jgi:excisionase family DNA binding protein
MTGRETEAVAGMEQLLTVPEVAAVLRVDDNTVRRWIRRGRLHGMKLGGPGGYRVRRSDLDAFLESLSTRDRSSSA